MKKKEKTIPFQDLFHDVVDKLKLPGRNITFALECADIKYDGECHPLFKYNEANIRFRFGLKEMNRRIKEDIYLIRSLVIHEVIHTWFSFYNDAYDDLRELTGNNMLVMCSNRNTYIEEIVVSKLEDKLYMAFRPEEYKKHKL